MRRYAHILFMLMLLIGSAGEVCAQNRNNLITAGGNLVLLIDLRSSKADIDSILKNAGIKGANANEVSKGNFEAITNDGWVLVTRQNNVVQFNLTLKKMAVNGQLRPFLITTELTKTENKQGYLDAIYGVNRFSQVTVTELPNGLTRFILPGYLNAKRVFLSGSFNQWSTLKGRMVKNATGWQIDIKLTAGGYEYKYIVDSRWMDDPNNLQQLNDGGGNINSVYFKYNYLFKLAGYQSAKKVTLAGSFNHWNENELFFEQKNDGWECPLYLHEGTYAYNFMVDGKRITDPVNPEKYTDEKGNINSVLKVGQTVYFRLAGHISAHSIYLAGDFNNWAENTISLKKVAGGWAIPVILSSGNYQYKFIVDGDWMTDPANPVHAIHDKQFNSFIAVNPTHTFTLAGYDNAKTVKLAGTFNNWDQNEYLMGHTGNQWSISVYLQPGKQLYKFIVDDQWILDPANKLREPNQQGTGNSFFWLE